jgi:hypothetical protein
VDLGIEPVLCCDFDRLSISRTKSFPMAKHGNKSSESASSVFHFRKGKKYAVRKSSGQLEDIEVRIPRQFVAAVVAEAQETAEPETITPLQRHGDRLRGT